MKKELLEYEKYTTNIIFFEPSPKLMTSTFKGPGDIARKFTFNHSSTFLDSLGVPRDVIEQNLFPSWARIKAAVFDCKKCIIIPTLDLFCDKTKCPITDSSGLSRYCDRSHLSEVGTDLMLPRLKNILNNIL